MLFVEILLRKRADDVEDVEHHTVQYTVYTIQGAYHSSRAGQNHTGGT